jgi:DNA-binding CsgD family transcriptional regulator
VSRDLETDPAPLLTRQQRVVIELVAAGLANRQIARRIGLSSQAVAYHVTRVMRGFGVENRAALVAKAYHTKTLCRDCWPPHAQRSGGMGTSGCCSVGRMGRENSRGARMGQEDEHHCAVADGES